MTEEKGWKTPPRCGLYDCQEPSVCIINHKFICAKHLMQLEEKKKRLYGDLFEEL